MKVFLIIILLFIGIKMSYAVHTRSQGDVFDVKEGWTTYYHVTRQENLKSIKKDGLLTFYGGTKQIRGMSALEDNRMYLRESMNHIHFGTQWQAASRYAQHMMKLITEDHQSADYIPEKDMPVILKCDAYKGKFTQDPHDSQAIRTKIDVSVNNVFILVTRSCMDDHEGYTSNETDEDEESFWLPLKNWDPRLQKPAYPDRDKGILQLDERTIRRLLAGRIELYSHSKLNKGDAAREVGVCTQTLDKFLDKDLSLRLSTKRKIINNFCKHFSRITRYDYHFVERESY